MFAAATVALADGRVALVVGNSTYDYLAPPPTRRTTPSTWPPLVRLGFDVTTELDADRVSLRGGVARVHAAERGDGRLRATSPVKSRGPTPITVYARPPSCLPREMSSRQQGTTERGLDPPHPEVLAGDRLRQLDADPTAHGTVDLRLQQLGSRDVAEHLGGAVADVQHEVRLQLRIELPLKALAAKETH